ncbi:sugar ABC transporter permease [Eisenbergiella tayi]|uniref:Putative multiple-sugar transport system permease YteP n=1 Tax=Eisenbergiella tayi TaxID=1432052 RepID=A0A1E3AI32_9FIRM|nr:ABC transporter permease subunit [Eisenbergiella tayi]ODM07856.1 putative multiple-sugar transport system permease YteP [Eisenbergiella tayi]OIZ59449.1 sugar ABC transporter permease [Eisenbergiella tayi]
MKRKKRIKHWQLYLFLVIPIVLVFIFNYIPMAGIQLAFKKYNMNLGIMGSPWIGFDNFKKFFRNYQFWRLLKNTLTLSLYGMLAGFPIPIMLALLLNSMNNLKYKKFIQTVTYMPHFISTVVMVGLIIQVFNPRIGLYGIIYSAVTGNNAPDVLGSASAFPHIYVLSGVWQSMGWNSIIYMAALAGVDAELHEAAQMDGASKFQRILHIDLPSILPTAIMLLILNAGSIMNIGFEKAFLMQNNLNLRSSEVISTYVYKMGLESATGDYGYATAIGLFNSVINLILIVSVNAVSKKVTEQSLW